MSCEVEQINNEVDNEVDNDEVEFVELLNHDDYEISTTHPFIIRRRIDGFIPKESINKTTGYVYVKLNNKPYRKHRLIALQFIDNPNNLPEVDHINHDKSDYHLENLRWVSHSINQRNQSSYNGVQAHYVDSIPDDSIVVDFYETQTERHEFEGYYYNDGVFYYDNDMNYRILNIHTVKCGAQFVSMRSKNNNKVSVYINRFLEQLNIN